MRSSIIFFLICILRSYQSTPIPFLFGGYGPPLFGSNPLQPFQQQYGIQNPNGPTSQYGQQNQAGQQLYNYPYRPISGIGGALQVFGRGVGVAGASLAIGTGSLIAGIFGAISSIFAGYDPPLYSSYGGYQQPENLPNNLPSGPNNGNNGNNGNNNNNNSNNNDDNDENDANN